MLMKKFLATFSKKPSSSTQPHHCRTMHCNPLHLFFTQATHRKNKQTSPLMILNPLEYFVDMVPSVHGCALHTDCGVVFTLDNQLSMYQH